jgi:hypothetical protein
MEKGWSLYKHQDQWHEEICSAATVTDAKLSLEIEDQEEGDTVTVTAVSTDGVRYQGDYRYREGSQSNGEVRLERYTGRSGEVFVGTWLEAGGSGGAFIVKLDRPD